MYGAQTDFVLAFGQAELEQLCPDGAGGVDVPRLDAALARASRMADTYISVRESVPVSSPSDDLIGAVMDMARFYLYDNQATEEVVRRYDQAVKWLGDISAGRAILSPPDGETLTPASSASVVAPAVIFTEAVVCKMPHSG